MNRIEVKQEFFPEQIPDINDISKKLDMHGMGHPIDKVSWKQFSYKPDVRFNIAYSEKEIFLKYYVKENYFKAEKTRTNQNVFEDSCVEFFISPSDDGVYYNIELNAICTCLMGTGTGRKNNKLVPAEIISKIRRISSREGSPEKEIRGNIEWTLTLAIPTEVLFMHKIESLKGKGFRTNFYKCGDMLSVPHYLSWNPVGTPFPDFHRPEYFGLLYFI